MKTHIYRYKYLPFTDGALETIKSGTIKYSDPLEFNDPFDCRPHYQTEAIILDAIKNKRHILRRAGNDMGLSPAKRIQYKNQFIANLRKSIKSGAFQSRMNARFGIVCLSRRPLNILMWSHYANEHKGFLIELKIPVFGPIWEHSMPNEWLIPHKIIYSKKRPMIGPVGHDPQAEFEQHSLTKSLDWRYEQEERVFDHIRGPGIHSYRRNEILCSVIAGMRMEPPEYKKLGAIINATNQTNDTNISLYKVKEVEGTFTLTVPKHPRLDKSPKRKVGNG